MPLLNVGERARMEAVEEADRQVQNWLNRLPKWKWECVDNEGAADMILFHAVSAFWQCF